MKHYTGAIKDTPDERDYQWSRVATGTNLFDWDKGFDVELELSKKLGKPFKLPSKDQGRAGSCGGQAWSYYGAVLEALVTGTYEERSAKFIYSQTVVPPAGSNGRPNCEVCINQGWALETDCPSYENGNPPSEEFMQRIQDITTEARNNASYSKALVYANVNPDIDLMANAVQANYGIVIGIEGQDNGTWLSSFPKPPLKMEWGHWLYVGGAMKINGKKYLKVKNSWGDTVGANGWQYIGEDYFNTYHVWPAWTLVFNKANLVAKLKGDQLSLMKKLLNLLKEQLAKMI